MSEIVPAAETPPPDAVPEPLAPDPLPMTLVVSTDKGPIVLAPNKGPGRPPREPDEWTEPFLRYYAEWGNMYNAARFAGVDAKTARKHRRSDAAFDRAVREARRAFIASMQEELVKQGKGLSRGNTIAVLARLKASGRKMAERYSEKAVDARVLNLTLNQTTNVISEDAARRLLSVSLGQITPATQRMLQGAGAAPEAVIDAELESAPGPSGPPPEGAQP